MAGLTDWFGQPDLSPEQNTWLQRQMLMSGIANLLQNSAPSTNPRAANMGYKLGSALEAGLGARNTGLAGMLAAEQQKKLSAEQKKQQALEEAYKGVKTTEDFPMPENAGYKISKPKDLSTLSADYMRAAMAAGDPHAAAQMATIYSATQKQPREFNIPADLDTFLAGEFKYNTPEDRMRALDAFHNDPKLKDKFITWQQKKAPQSFLPIGLLPNGQVALVGNRTGETKTANPGGPLQSIPAGPGALLSPQEAADLGVPYGTTRGGATKENVYAITPGQRENIAQVESAKNVVKQLRGISDKVPAGTGLVGRLTTGLENKYGSITQTDPYATMLDKTGARLSTLIRGLGEKGTLAEGDVKRGMESVPNVWDSKEVRKMKLDTIEEILNGVGTSRAGIYTQKFKAGTPPKKVGRFTIEAE